MIIFCIKSAIWIHYLQNNLHHDTFQDFDKDANYLNYYSSEAVACRYFVKTIFPEISQNPEKIQWKVKLIISKKRSFSLRICLYLLKMTLTESFNFCAVQICATKPL